MKRTLEPSGSSLRDFAPRAAAARRVAAEALLDSLERCVGARARVITPAFGSEETLALGLGAVARASALRLLEPSSGEVVAVRPDIAPQIARLSAARHRDEEGPVRPCYQGTAVRLERGGRGQRELIQAGGRRSALVVGPGFAARDAEELLRGQGVRAAVDLVGMGPGARASYAECWGFDEIVSANKTTAQRKTERIRWPLS